MKFFFVNFILIFFFYSYNHAQLVLSNQGGDPLTIATSLVGDGITILNPTINCPTNSYGTFSNGSSTCVGLETGILLTTGDLANIGLPAGTQNYSPNMSTQECGGNGPVNSDCCNDPQITSLEPLAIYDCCILEFDIIPSCDALQIRFVFGSEEYPEYVSSNYNDAFGFFVTGVNPSGGNYTNQNVAVFPNGAIASIDNISPTTNTGYYVNNQNCTNIVFDGITTTITSTINVVPCETYHFKLAIADAGDPIYDSGVFVDFLDCVNTLTTSVSSTDATCAANDGTATVVATDGYPDYTYSWNTTPPQTTATATGLAPGTYEVSVDDAGACTPPVVQTVVVGSSAVNATPTFTQQAPICSGDNFTLPTTSNNGFTGSWSPVIDNTTTTTYTFTPDPGQCADPATMTVEVGLPTIPTFTQQAPICIGDNFTLSTSSNEGITGTWSPAIDNTQTTTYLFTSDAGQCATTQTMTVTVSPLVTPTFAQLGPFCQGSVVSDITTTSNEGIIGSWSPAIDNNATTTYTFTPNAGQCSNNQTMDITIDPLVTPTFTQQAPICSGDNFTLSTSSNEGITGTWSPAIDNTTTTTYTFTPDGGQCSNIQTMTVSVGPPITPAFAQQAPICAGDNFTLATSSNEGITGTWSPAIDNTQTTTYTFTPDVGQCALTQTMTVTVNPLITPSFIQVGPYCEGTGVPDITTSSNEGITGIWSPSIDNTTTTTYTFTPNAGQCSNTQTMDITIDPLTTPTFTQQPPICSGDNFTLSASSNEGISGTWSPAIDNTMTTTYTFTPDGGQCSNTQTMTVTVGPPTTPTFALLGPFCVTGNIDALPTTSLEGFTGTWNPAIVDNSTEGLFTSAFTPDPGLCATDASIDIEITAAPSITAAALDSTLCDGESAVLFATDISGGQLVETFTMDVNAPFSYTTSNTGAPGNYYIIVSGTIIAMGGEVRDANYQFILNNNAVNPPVPGSVWQWNGASAGSQSTTPFAYNPSHVYNYFFNGGAPQTFTFADSGPYTDNSGSLVFEIYYMGDLLWSTGSTEISDTVVPSVGTTTYSVSIDFGNGCMASDDVDIVVDPLVVPSFTQLGPFCQGDIAPALPLSSLEGISGVWGPPGINTGALGSTLYAFVPEDGQCADIQTMTIDVVTPSEPTFDLVSSICNGDELVLPTSSIEGINGTWSPIIDNTQTTTYTFTPDVGLCALETDETVVVLEAPIIEAGEEQTVCIGQEVILNGSGAGVGGTYVWDNGVEDGEAFVVNGTMTYTVTGTDPNGCVGTATVVVNGLPIPVAQFTASPENGEVPLDVVFTNTSQNANSFAWDFGNGESALANDESAQNAVYLDYGVYTVWLVAENGFCADSMSAEITTTAAPWIFVPNVFTPNGDDANELWMVDTRNMQTIDLIIVNRWGNLMAKIEDLQGGWDGKTLGGMDAKDGTYFYKYTAKAINGEEFTGHGFLTLIR